MRCVCFECLELFIVRMFFVRNCLWGFWLVLKCLELFLFFFEFGNKFYFNRNIWDEIWSKIIIIYFFFSFLMKVNVSKTERYRIEKSIADNRGRIKRNSFPIDMIIFNDKSTFIRRLLNKYIFDGLNGWREGAKNSKEFRYFHPIRNLK